MVAPRNESSPTSPRESRVTREKSEGYVEPEAQAGKFGSEIARWTAQAESDPVGAAYRVQRSLGHSKKEYDEHLWRELVHVYIIASILVRSRRKWLAFINDKFWQRPGHKPKEDDAENALKWMMQLAFNARDDRAKARANGYRGALQPLFEANADPEDIFDYIKRSGGIDRLYRLSPSAAEVKVDKDDLPDEGDEHAGARQDYQVTSPRVPSCARTSVEADPKVSSPPGSQKPVSPNPSTVHNGEKGTKQASERLTLSKRAKLIESKGKRAVLVAMEQSDLDRLHAQYGEGDNATLDFFVKAEERWVNLDCLGLSDSG